MKALSIKQPWASLIAEGHKLVENRNWNTKFRGEFYIHASKQLDKEGYKWVRYNFPEINIAPERLEYGGIVGKVTLIPFNRDLTKVQAREFCKKFADAAINTIRGE